MKGIFWGFLILGVSIGLLLFEFRVRLPVFGRIEWRRIEEFWPGFILVVGAAYLGQFMLSGLKDRWAAISGLMICAIGCVAFAITLGFVYAPRLQAWTIYWPFGLLVLYIWIVAQSLIRRA